MRTRHDGDLLRAFRTADDQAAFAELMRRHGRLVFGAAVSVVGAVHTAQDVAQATFLTLVRKGAALEQDVSVAGWLHRVALCLARDRRRQERSRAAREQEAAMLTAQVDTPHTAPPPAALAALHEELGRLPEKFRQPLILHHFEGLSYEDAAAALGCNRVTFGTRLLRAREKLRQRLVKRGVTLGADGIGGVLEDGATTAVLPTALVAATCQAASLLAAGKTLSGSGLVSAKVAYLTKSALKTLFWAKVKTAAAAVVLTAGVAVGGGLVAHRAFARPHALPPPVAAVRPPATPAAPLTGGMVPIPGGTNAGTDPDTQQPYSLTVAPFLMDRCEVTKALWDEVAAWGREHGYGILMAPGRGKAPDHPVHSVTWYDCALWCNARSEKDGFTPVYYADKAGTYLDRQKATADGYRLPTLVEWQYAARGGQPSHRFPWHDTETIDHSRANYDNSQARPFDTSSTRGYHPTYAVDPKPYTSPVGAFPPNAYGLYDMAGNVSEWCADEVNLSFRPYAGSSWASGAAPVGASTAIVPETQDPRIGFRTVRTPRATPAPKSAAGP